jgi:uncharacterized protein with PQ loop repeat
MYLCGQVSHDGTGVPTRYLDCRIFDFQPKEMIVGNIVVVNFVGAVAATFSFILFLPQAFAVWKYRHGTLELSGASLGMPLLVFGNEGFWVSYAILTGDFWIGATAIVNVPLAALMLCLIGKSRRRRTELQAMQCTHCRFAHGAHLIFATTPAQFGTLLECSSRTAKRGIPVPRNPADVSEVLVASAT